MRFAFVSGSPALDLVGTVEFRRSEPVDLLDTPGALEQWVLQCDELPAHVTADAATFDSAVRLREGLYQLAFDRLRGARFTRAGLEVVNAAAAGPLPTAELGDAGLRLSGDLRSALAHVARSGITLLADRHVCMKECGAPHCTRLYLDRSRGARRTWCGMDSCGNRAKVAAHRARRQDAEQAPRRGRAATSPRGVRP